VDTSIASDSVVFLRHCALYKFIYLLLITTSSAAAATATTAISTLSLKP